jgi:hypothetical protein
MDNAQCPQNGYLVSPGGYKTFGAKLSRVTLFWFKKLAFGSSKKWRVYKCVNNAKNSVQKGSRQKLGDVSRHFDAYFYSIYNLKMEFWEMFIKGHTGALGIKNQWR